MVMLGNRRGLPRQGGVATVEFVIGLPLLLALLMVTAEVGRLLSQYDTLTKSVRDGARYIASKALQGTTGIVAIQAADQTATQNLVVYGNPGGTGSPLLPGLTTNNVTVTTINSNTYVSVSASYTYVPMLGSNLPNFGIGSSQSLGFALTSTVVMRPL